MSDSEDYHTASESEACHPSTLGVGIQVLALRSKRAPFYEHAMVAYVEEGTVDVVFDDGTELDGVEAGTLVLPYRHNEPVDALHYCQRLKDKGKRNAERGDYLSAARAYGRVLCALEGVAPLLDGQQEGYHVGSEVQTERGPATVTYINKDGTYDVLYDDGDEEDSEVPASKLRPMPPSTSPLSDLYTLRAACRLNAVRCALKLQCWREALGICEQIVSSNPQSGAGHYLLAKAQAGLGKCDHALGSLKRASKLLPGNHDVAAFKAKVKSLCTEQAAKDQQLLREMMQWMSQSGAGDALGGRLQF